MSHEASLPALTFHLRMPTNYWCLEQREQPILLSPSVMARKRCATSANFVLTILSRKQKRLGIAHCVIVRCTNPVWVKHHVEIANRIVTVLWQKTMTWLCYMYKVLWWSMIGTFKIKTYNLVTIALKKLLNLAHWRNKSGLFSCPAETRAGSLDAL